MTARKVRVWDWRPRFAETVEVVLPKHWHLETLTATGEIRDTYVRLMPDGVRTEIVASQMPGRDPVWSMMTTWSSNWTNPHGVYEVEFFGDHFAKRSPLRGHRIRRPGDDRRRSPGRSTVSES